MTDKTDKKWSMMSDGALLEVIGNFINWHRLNQNKSQEQVAAAAGISRSTLSLLEKGEKVRMDSFLQVIRVLDLLHIMDVFEVQDQISPLAYAKVKRKQRQRASPKSEIQDKKSDLGW